MSGPSITIEAIFLIVIGLVIVANPQILMHGRCGTGEWSCFTLDRGLNCIPLNKYCDGIRNCPDGSDEPPDCTNCNQTYSGRAGTKFPLRVTQRSLPFVCQVNFVAMGGDFGDAVELSFLAFQIGKFEFSKDLLSACKKGYMRIHEPSPSPLEATHVTPQFGSFCGRLTDRSATFYSHSSNVTLYVIIPASIRPVSFSLFLTYRFMKWGVTHRNHAHFGNALPGTFCDRMYLNCHLRPCLIRSPNFPGFYPRNVTCNYHVRQMQVPHASTSSIVLTQSNDYKVFIPRGGDASSTNVASNLRSGSSLSIDCHGNSSDSVRVFDGSTSQSPLLAQFCGNGPIPSVISSGPEILVQLYSAPHSVLCSSRLELEVTVKFEAETVSYMQKDRRRCAYIIDANRHRRKGVIVSPKYTMPENSSCTYKFIGASSYDRLWLYFIVYLSRTKVNSVNNPENKDSVCAGSRLEMFDSRDSWSMIDLNEDFDTLPVQFCGENRIPRLCSHAADYPQEFSPSRPCKFPEESYLSSGPTFALRHTFLSTLDFVDIFNFNSFKLKYEFVDTRQDGVAIGQTECDRRFDSRTAKGGFISNPKNTFLYGRGGRENVSCSFHFVGLPSERVRITIFNVKLSLNSPKARCVSRLDGLTQRHTCVETPSLSNSSERMAYLRGVEYWDNHSSSIGCLCNLSSTDKSKKFTFDSLVNNVKLVFSVNDMTAFEDFTHFNFDAKFEFFNSTFCDTHLFDGQTGLSPEGTLEFHVPHGRTNFSSGEDMLQPLRCRWQVKATSEKYLYLQFRGLETNTEICKDGMLVLIYLQTHFSKPTTVACVASDTNLNNKDYHVFSQSWYQETFSIIDSHKDFVFIEIVATSKWKGIKLLFHWMEVTKPFYRGITGRPLRNIDCIFECPEIGACIDPHLWCDGTKHCPSGFDESPINCHPLAKGMEYLSLILSMAIAVLLISGCLIAWALIRHRHRRRSSSDHSSDDRTKDYNHRLSPTDDFPMENHMS